MRIARVVLAWCGRAAVGAGWIVAIAAVIGGCRAFGPSPSVTPPPVAVSIVLANDGPDPIRITVVLEGRAEGAPDPGRRLGMYPEYRLPPGRAIVVFEGPMSGTPFERQLSFSVRTDRCEWLADSPLQDAPFQPSGDVLVRFDADGRTTGPVAAPGPPDASLPRPNAEPQCS